MSQTVIRPNFADTVVCVGALLSHYLPAFGYLSFLSFQKEVRPVIEQRPFRVLLPVELIIYIERERERKRERETVADLRFQVQG